MKLKELCLDSVCANLDLYILAYKTSKNEELIQNIEVLRRFYSFVILDKMYQCTDKSEVKTVLSNHLHFLINQYIKELDVGLLKGYEWNTIVKKFAEIGSSLETVVLRGQEPWEEVICQLPNLREIEVEYCQNNFLKCISEHCPILKSLRMRHYDEIGELSIPEIGLKKCSELRTVSVNFFNDHQTCLNLFMYLLQNLPNLEELGFRDMPEIFHMIHKDSMNNLESVTPYNLTVLNLRTNFMNKNILNDSLRICARLCPQVKSLTTYIQNQENLICVSKFAELQRFMVLKKGDSPVDLDEFLKENGKRFTFLTIAYFSLSVDNLIRSCLNVIELHLHYITFLNVCNDRNMPELFNLKFLELCRFRLDFLTVQAFSSLLSRVPNLEKLEFIFCNGGSFSEMEDCFFKCSKQSTIRHLTFFCSSIRPEFAKDILRMFTTLESFSYGTAADLDFLDEGIEEFKAIALLLPNKPQILKLT